jgi:hypothetical protein
MNQKKNFNELKEPIEVTTKEELQEALSKGLPFSVSLSNLVGNEVKSIDGKCACSSNPFKIITFNCGNNVEKEGLSLLPED